MEQHLLDISAGLPSECQRAGSCQFGGQRGRSRCFQPSFWRSPPFPRALFRAKERPGWGDEQALFGGGHRGAGRGVQCTLETLLGRLKNRPPFWTPRERNPRVFQEPFPAKVAGPPPETRFRMRSPNPHADIPDLGINLFSNKVILKRDQVFSEHLLCATHRVPDGLASFVLGDLAACRWLSPVV